VMPFHQFLEARLDVWTSCAILQPQDVKRFPLRITDGPSLGLGAGLCCTGARTTEFPQDVERIGGGEIRIQQQADLFSCAALAADHSNPPGGEMSGERIFLKARTRIVAHAGKKIIGLIVFANVIEAEPPVFALSIATFWRPVARRF